MIAGEIIAADVQQLATIFKSIDEQCTILGFDRQQNYINFLNVGSFEGSQIGPMNLKYPRNWQGPYLADNPTIQTKEYMVVQTKTGYYIAPGNGVKLPNGKVVGTDIIFGKDADMDGLSKELTFRDKSFIQKLNI